MSDATVITHKFFCLNFPLVPSLGEPAKHGNLNTVSELKSHRCFVRHFLASKKRPGKLTMPIILYLLLIPIQR